MMLRRRPFLLAVAATAATLLAAVAPRSDGQSFDDNGPPAAASPSAHLDVPLAAAFEVTVAQRLRPPSEAIERYARLLDKSLADAGVRIEASHFVVLVDRSPQVQALLLFWGRGQAWQLVGASPVSTGQPGRFDHFVTPTGVYGHSLDNMDFRALGTKNELGIRGYGRKGMRVFDFGWVAAPKGWGDHAVIEMRLQMHATDPDHLEARLGTAQSKGCIRIPASLNVFLDRFAVLDEDYEQGLSEGRRLWVLRGDRSQTPWSGRFLVVVDSLSGERPAWSPQPTGMR